MAKQWMPRGRLLAIEERVRVLKQELGLAVENAHWAALIRVAHRLAYQDVPDLIEAVRNAQEEADHVNES